jgi:penicillin-binding protein 2
MPKRIIKIFLFLFVCFVGIFIKLHKIAIEESFCETAASQNCYRLKIADIRGEICDCRNVPLVGSKFKLFASVIPCFKTFEAISKVIPESAMNSIEKKFKSGLPFAIEIEKEVNCEGIDVLKIPVRHGEIIPAVHIMGYLSSEGKGVCGIEQAFDEYLNSGEIEVKYEINALGKLTCKNSYREENFSNGRAVMLHLDKRIQILSEKISNKYICKGAVVVTEVPNCQIRACVSLPGFLPGGVKHCLKDKNSPMLNRAMSQYNVGSVFKLVTAAAALESGFDDSFVYTCGGSYKLDDQTEFHCFGGVPHGTIDMKNATALSCNGFFSKIVENMDPNLLLKISRDLGFGESVKFAPHIESAKGNLPTSEELQDIRKLSMFSFGQSSLMATPVQISGLINAICCGGVYYKPELVKSLIDKEAQIVDFNQDFTPKRVFGQKTAAKLRNYMKKAIQSGTAKPGNPKTVSAAAKTSTAETGILDEDGKYVNQSWFAGFFPFENPKYCVVVLSENDETGGKNCGSVFKEIAEEISRL